VSNLENRYRRLSRVLPAWYRAEREEEMVGLFMAGREDDLDQEHDRPAGARPARPSHTRCEPGSPPPARPSRVVGLVVVTAALIVVGRRGLRRPVPITP
jgi:hypothetical protein